MPSEKVLIVAHSVKLPGEVRGLDRHPCVAAMLADAGFDVTLATSRFQHWDKAHRKDISRFEGLPYKVAFVDEPGYLKNVDPLRIASQAVFTRNLGRFLSEDGGYDAMICSIPPNRVAAACAEFARDNNIPLVADLNDLWPEAMQMIFDVPVLSDAAYAPMRAQAKTVYRNTGHLVGTSDEYACYPKAAYGLDVPHSTVHVGIDLAKFDSDAAAHPIAKPAGQRWVTYAGTVGACYGLDVLVKAARQVEQDMDNVRFKVIGDGPDAEDVRKMAEDLEAPCDFTGYVDHAEAVAWLCASDVLVNSLRPNAPQSIPSKIADYLAAGRPVLNTGQSPELARLLEKRDCGISVQSGDVAALAGGVEALLDNPGACQEMGANGRALAEEKFDRNSTYREFERVLDRLIRN